MTSTSPSRSAAVGNATTGSRAVLAMVGLAAALACFAVWFQWRQTRRCLAFYGAPVARAVQSADRVELWSFVPGGGPPRVGRSIDVSRAAGLVHLRRGLVEDANFEWAPPAPGRLPGGGWDSALAFYAGPSAEPAAVLALDLDGGGWLTVVGRPGRIGLGRMVAGLRTWIGEAIAADRR